MLHHKRRLVRETGGVGRSSSGGLAEESFQQVGQIWDGSQVEAEPEERTAIEWLMDVEMMSNRRPFLSLSRKRDARFLLKFKKR